MVLLSPILGLLSLIYSIVMLVRAWFYQVGVLPSESSGAFVLSIGNIQAGGTGKTPIVEYFARRWRGRQRLGIVSRGYGRKTSGSLRVDLSASESSEMFVTEKFGDEPTWLAKSLSTGAGPIVPVQVGEKRAIAARDLIASEGVKLILLDDGFQHLALRRSFDIVLIDLSVEDWQLRVLPAGRLREPLSALNRADLIIFTKTESIPLEHLKLFESLIQGLAKTSKFPALHFHQTISWDSMVPNEPLILAAGLARPEAFFKMVRDHKSQPQVFDAIAFPDHHAYAEKDVQRLLEIARSRGAKRVLVTEKDAVKLEGLWNKISPGTTGAGIELIVSKLEVGPAREVDKEQLERLDEIILDEVRGVSGRGSGAQPRLSHREPAE
jgi:tetraacyldisaccharide 4'-kinase